MVNALLTAIVRADGDALVMHVGERPYVVAAGGPVELSTRPLTLEAVAGMLGQLLPPEARRALDELGAIEHELGKATASHGERFTVVAARGGDDLWIEIRRHRVMPPEALVPPPAEPAGSLLPDVASVPRPPAVGAPLLPPPETGQAAPGIVRQAQAPGIPRAEAAVPSPAVPAAPASLTAPPQAFAPAAAPCVPAAKLPVAPAPEAPAFPVATPVPERQDMSGGPAVGRSLDRVLQVAEESVAAPEWPAAVAEHVPPPAASEPPQAVVLPLARNPVRPEAPPRVLQPPRLAGLERLLRLAAARGGNTLYLMSESRPSIRVDGEIAPFDGEPVLTAPEVESLLLDLAPEMTRQALRNGDGTEWMSEVPEVGQVRCQSFRDHRGPGGIFRIISNRATTAEQLGLSREVQALCGEPEGLVLVAGPRASGKSTLLSALVDLINRTRNDYVITIESQIKCAHENRGCLISQREVRGNNDELAAAVRTALRESPDIFVIDNLRSPKVISLALDAMETGHLVIGAVAAHTTATAIGRLLDQLPPERREQGRLTLAEGLRGVVSQVLIHKIGGGRVAARELLINTPPIASLIAEGRIGQLPLALDSGRKHGMVPLNDALAAFVQTGIVDVKDAYRKAYDRQAFLAILKREGIDTSFVERLA